MKTKNKLFSRLSSQAKKTDSRLSDYKARFLREPDVRAKEGKLVYVSQKHHECIKHIAQTVGKNEVSIYGIIDNIIAEHFTLHKEEITELYNGYDNPMHNI